jgi:hypothetical protein
LINIGKRVPYIGPVISAVGLAMDIKDIAESSTPIGAAKTIGGRFLKECTPPELLIAGRCVMLIGGVVASIGSGGNRLLVVQYQLHAQL